MMRALGLLGAARVRKLDRSYLHAAAPHLPRHVFSAFPLMEIEPYRY